MLSLLEAVGLALAEDLRADRDFPPFPRSTRDGFAVRSADTSNVACPLAGCRRDPRRSDVASKARLRVNAGEAVEIMTGAPVPAGADAVVMVEYTERKGRIRDGAALGEPLAKTLWPPDRRRGRAT